MQTPTYGPRSERAHNPAFHTSIIGLLAFCAGLILGSVAVSGPHSDRTADGQVASTQAALAETGLVAP